MALLVSDVYSTCRFLLNDMAASLYVDATLLQAVIKALDDLAGEFILHDAPASIETSADILVNVAVVSLAAVALMPTDLFEVISIEEKVNGAEDALFTPMTRQTVELPTRDQTDVLNDWIYEEGDIKFVGATTAREIRIRYFKPFATISSGASTVAILNARQYLAERAAALSAASIGENYQRAQYLNDAAQVSLGNLLGVIVKGQQGKAVRRMPWRPRLS